MMLGTVFWRERIELRKSLFEGGKFGFDGFSLLDKGGIGFAVFHFGGNFVASTAKRFDFFQEVFAFVVELEQVIDVNFVAFFFGGVFDVIEMVADEINI